MILNKSTDQIKHKTNDVLYSNANLGSTLNARLDVLHYYYFTVERQIV